MFKNIKAWRRRRWLSNAGIVVQEDLGENVEFYGARTGVWPLYIDGVWRVKTQPLIIYAFGVGNNLSWELDVLKAYNADIYAYDPTPGSVDWVANQKLPDQLHFSPIGIADYCGELEFFTPHKPGLFNYSVVKRSAKYPAKTVSCPVKNLATICADNQHTHIDILKMDIEGAEMTALPDALDSGISIKQILIEFHYNFNGIDFQPTVELIELLFAKGYRLYWISNRAYEFGFIKK